MNTEEMLGLQKDIEKLHDFCNGGAIRKDNKNFTGFNKISCCSHSVADRHCLEYCSLVEKDGIGCPQIVLSKINEGVFWACFDEVLNENEDFILNKVCEKMKIRLSEEIATKKRELATLENMLKES